MDSDKPDFTGLLPPKQFRRIQELAATITGSPAIEKMRAHGAVMEKFKADNAPLLEVLRAQSDAVGKVQANYTGLIEKLGLQSEGLRGFRVPKYLTDLSLTIQSNFYSHEFRSLLRSVDHLTIDQGTASYLQSLSDLTSSFSNSEINRTLRKIGLLVAEVEEHRQVAPRPAEVQQSLERLRGADTAEEFSGIFGGLPEVVKVILCVFLLKIAEASFDFIVNVTANLATPEVQALIDNPELSQREKVAKARSAPLEIAPEFKSHVRFINAERVNLRLEPSIKSTIVTVMSTGRVVTILSKRRNWIEVTFADENGDEFEGWVFTRYTSRFR